MGDLPDFKDDPLEAMAIALDPLTMGAQRGVATKSGLHTPTSDLKTQANEVAVAEETKLSEDEAAFDASELERKKRNAMFQTEGGSSGDAVLNVGARDTYFGN